jgi:hypothetical protein
MDCDFAAHAVVILLLQNKRLLTMMFWRFKHLIST